MKDTQETAPVAPSEAESLEETENPLLASAAALIEQCADRHATEDSREASEAWWDESPILEGAARWPEACAAFCMAAFGSQIVPEVDQDKHGTDSQNALQIARVYLAAPVGSPARQALEVLALAAHRLLQTEDEAVRK